MSAWSCMKILHRRNCIGAAYSFVTMSCDNGQLHNHVARILSLAASVGGIRLLAIDFDATIVQIHTGGRWTGSADTLAAHVRPVFTAMLQEAVKIQDMHVAVVTFSGQTELIRKVLAIVLGGNEIAGKIIIRCEDGSWKTPKGFSEYGKQGHIGSAMECIYKLHKQKLSLSNVLLVDDDPRNIRIASEAGVCTLLFPAIELQGYSSAAHCVEAKGITVTRRLQLSHGAILCISLGDMHCFNGGPRGAIVQVEYVDGLDRSDCNPNDIVNACFSAGCYGGTIHIQVPLHDGNVNSIEGYYASAMHIASEQALEHLALPVLYLASLLDNESAALQAAALAVDAVCKRVYVGAREIHIIGADSRDIEIINRAIDKALNEADNFLCIGSDGRLQVQKFLRDFEMLVCTERHTECNVETTKSEKCCFVL